MPNPIKVIDKLALELRDINPKRTINANFYGEWILQRAAIHLLPDLEEHLSSVSAVQCFYKWRDKHDLTN